MQVDIDWHKFPEEKPSLSSEYLVRGIGGINNQLHHWICYYLTESVCESLGIKSGFYYNGNEFNQCPSGEYEWLDVKEI